MNEQEQLEALHTYFDLMTMNGGAQIFHIAQQVGILKALAEKPMTAVNMARACGMKEKPVELLLDGLCGLKVVQQKADLYALTPAVQFLVGDYQNLSNKYWRHLPEYLKTGTPMARMDDLTESEKQYKAQVTALDWMMRPSAAVAAQMLGIGDRMKGLAMLDIGAGSGVWSLTFASRDTSSTVTAVDWPTVLQIAEASALKQGFGDRFTALPGNYHELDFPSDHFDLAIVGNVVHIETEEGNRSLLKKIHASLKPDGRVVIFDVFGGQEDGQLAKALYAIGLALRTEQGQVYAPETIQGLLEELGYRNCAYTPLPVTPYTMGMLVGER